MVVFVGLNFRVAREGISSCLFSLGGKESLRRDRAPQLQTVFTVIWFLLGGCLRALQAHKQCLTLDT